MSILALPAFSDDTAACMVFSETISAMLLTHDMWRQFTSKRIVDAHADAQVLLCLSADSRDEVSSMVDKASGAGGRADPTPVQGFGFMYGRSFEEPDGRIWEGLRLILSTRACARPLNPSHVAMY
ncbi:glyoxalase/bleomycin resistance/extradiol dioxygenase family protein [Paraburkholderia sp. SIMBA_053]|uniref:glyoxalase/bleomycin resistance/extradiol dioxygenase family protein n=1 Tax=Paraburkholderia sp. SIMBA_053 TaxID=3085794 RepID=UPI00397B3718